MELLIDAAFALVLATASHELGHFLCGRAVGLKTRLDIVWREAFGRLKYPNPCVRFDEGGTASQLHAFGIGGFGGEFATLAGLAVAHSLGVPYIESANVGIYAVIATAHLISYPFRNAGHELNDFHWLD